MRNTIFDKMILHSRMVVREKELLAYEMKCVQEYLISCYFLFNTHIPFQYVHNYKQQSGEEEKKIKERVHRIHQGRCIGYPVCMHV